MEGDSDWSPAGVWPGRCRRWLPLVAVATCGAWRYMDSLPLDPGRLRHLGLAAVRFFDGLTILDPGVVPLDQVWP